MHWFGGLSGVLLLVPPLVWEVAAVELGDRPEPGHAHQSQCQEDHPHGWTGAEWMRGIHERSSRMRHCLDQGKPQPTPSSTGISIQKRSFCPAIILLLHLLHHVYLAPVHKHPPCVGLLTTAPSALLTSADTCYCDSPPSALKYQFIPIMTKEYH